jgi:hypothetical protein
MRPDLDERPSSVDGKPLRDALEQVVKIVSGLDIPRMNPGQLLEAVSAVLETVTPTELHELLSERLVKITERSPEDMIAVTNPSVQLLKRRPAEDEAAEPDQIAELLDESEGYASYKMGDLVLDMNPYFSVTDAIVSDQQINDATSPNRQGGPFRGFNSLFIWQKGDAQFPKIPKPGEGPTGADRSWYMLTRKTPKSLPDPISSLPAADLVRVRNIVKTVEIVYGSQVPDADGQIGIDTGELWPPGHALEGKPKKKPAHVFVMYAGGNGT